MKRISPISKKPVSKIKLRINTDNKEIQWREVDAIIMGQFCYHKQPISPTELSSHQYSITHVKSGLRLFQGTFLEDQVKRFCSLIERLAKKEHIEWSGRGEVPERFRKFLHRSWKLFFNEEYSPNDKKME